MSFNVGATLICRGVFLIMMSSAANDRSDDGGELRTLFGVMSWASFLAGAVAMSVGVGFLFA